MLINGKRALAHIQKIVSVNAIPGADNIVSVYVLGWQLIAKKDEFKVGDLCVYIEIDSTVPYNDERFEFLEQRHFKIKTMKLSKFNVISQGIAFPVSMFPEIKNPKVDMDVTDLLKITKTVTAEEKRLRREEEFLYKSKGKLLFSRAVKKHPKFFNSKLGKFITKFKFFRNFFGKIWGGKVATPKKYPSWIIKTDEERIENIPSMLDYKNPLIVTEKVDGTSTTFALRYTGKNKYDTYVCSRNVVQITDEQSCYFESNVYHDMWKKYNVEELLKILIKKLSDIDGFSYDYIILQGETFGYGIQGNPYKAKDISLRAFNLIVGITEANYNFKKIQDLMLDPQSEEKINSIWTRIADSYQKRINSVEASKLLEECSSIKWVPILNTDHILPDTMEDMKKQATGNSVINNEVLREGLVYRSEINPSISFKNVSKEYLIKKGE